MRFGGLTAVGNVSITVARGEIRAIIGPNGAGKSTFFNCVTGVLRPTGGRILLNGENVAGLPPHRISHKGLARSYQITNILPGATVAGERAHRRPVPAPRLEPPRGITGSFHDLIDRARSVLEAVGLAGRRTSSPPTSPTASSAISRSPSRWPPSPSSCASTSRPRA